MGMTIDKTIEFFNGLECHTPQAKDAKDVAVNTMRKYQQIEEIYKEWFSDAGRTSADAYSRIGEVLKDGNDD